MLLDGDNNPIRPWAGIPRCFSSKIEGGRIEALRRILPMTIQDIRGRMLRAVPTGAEAGASTKPLSFASTFGHRCSRFRAQYQTPAWNSRAASSVLKQQVTDLLPEAEEATTTEGLQALTTYEINRRKLSTRGKFLYKGNGRTISEDERKERDRKFDEKLERQAASQPTTPRRPQSMPTQLSSPCPYLPTPPLSAGSKRSREDDGFGDSGVGQSEPTTKRGRLGASRLDPRVQSPSLASQAVPEDPFQQGPNAFDASDVVSNIDPHHGQSGSNATGLGLNFGGGDPIVPENLAPSQDTGVPEPPSQQPEATNTEATASTNDSQPDNFQLDYRFVYPRNPLEQLRIQAALFYPRAHYYALIGQHPPHTSEGTYADQYLQIVALLEQNWVLLEGPPALADVGFWSGSFDTVPMPVLPDGMMWIMLHPTHGALPGPEAWTGDFCAQGSSADIGAEDVQRVSNFSTRLEGDDGANCWSDYSFGDSIEGVEHADADEK